MDPTTSKPTDSGATAQDGGQTGGKPDAAGDQGGAPKPTLLGDGAEGDKGAQDKKPEGETGGGEPAKSKDGTDAALEINLPEGTEVDPETLTWFTAAAKDGGLNSEQASKLAAGFVELQKAQAAKLETEKADWEKSLAADPEIGGQKWAESLQTSKGAVKRFATPGFINLLNETGLGSHPDVVRTFLSIGRAIQEDNNAGSRSAGNPPMTDRELNDLRFPSSKGVGR